jgi:hypothetical protein
MIEEIRRMIRDQAYEYFLDAADQSILRRISRREVEEAVESGEVIEDYPSDNYGPSCLIWQHRAPDRLIETPVYEFEVTR